MLHICLLVNNEPWYGKLFLGIHGFSFFPCVDLLTTTLGFRISKLKLWSSKLSWERFCCWRESDATCVSATPLSCSWPPYKGEGFVEGSWRRHATSLMWLSPCNSESLLRTYWVWLNRTHCHFENVFWITWYLLLKVSSKGHLYHTYLYTGQSWLTKAKKQMEWEVKYVFC